jgi:hypothetical protein
LVTGILIGFAGLSNEEVKGLNSCVPKEWQVVDTTPIPNDTPKEEDSSTWTTIVNGLESIFNLVCTFKDKIKSMFQRKIRREFKKNKYKIFLQKNKRIFDQAKAFFKKAASEAAQLAKKGWDQLKTWAKEFVENVKIFLNAIKTRILSFLPKELQDKVSTFIDCIVKARKAAAKIITAVKDIVKFIPKVASMAAGNGVEIAGFVIDLVCNYKIFKQAFEYLSESFTKTNLTEKYHLIGKFIGTILKAVTH